MEPPSIKRACHVQTAEAATLWKAPATSPGAAIITDTVCRG